MADGATSRQARRSYPDLSPRDPSKSALHAILRDHLETFLGEREEAGAPLPRFVTKELRAALSCGVLRNGCAHYRCDGCDLSRVVALSCKGRGFCPRCIGRQMTVLARDLTERVFPPVRSRQYVLSFPFGLRCALAFDHELTLALTRIAQEEIERRYRRLARAAGLSKPRGGAFVAIQRCGSDLRPNVHLHMQFLDGAYGTNAHGREVFFQAPAPTPADVEAILTRMVTRARPLLTEHEHDLDALDETERSLAQTLAAATSTRGTTSHAPELDDEHGAQVHLPTRRKARIEDFDLDAEVAIAPHDRERREAMFRYFLRPPLAHDRLTYLPARADSRVLLSLKRPRSDGTTHVEMTPASFLSRLASLVPRPRKNTRLYFGVLAARARGRARIVPAPTRDAPRHHDASWACLMLRSFGLDVLGCPRCKARLRFVAVIHDREEVRRLLQSLHLWTDPIPIRPARAPPGPPDGLDFP